MRRKIRYAAGGDYVEDKVLNPSSLRVPWGESDNNPLSPNFENLTGRDERGKARFWAAHSRRKKSGSTHGVFDA